MKTSIYLLLALSFALFTITSCDKVDFPTTCGDNSTTSDTLDTLDLNLKRRVLLVDFTGHRCQGCPGGARLANNLATEFHDEIFVLAIHPNVTELNYPQTNPDGSFSTDWRTPEGNAYQNTFDFLGLPVGSVSFSEENGNLTFAPASWRPIAEEKITEQRLITTELDITYDTGTREALLDVSFTFHDEMDASLSYILAVAESNIVDWQKNGESIDAPADPDFPGGDIPNYIHNHVLREHVNGIQGSPIGVTTIPKGDILSFSETHIISQLYDDSEVSIYAYIYDTNTLEIIDVVEQYVNS